MEIYNQTSSVLASLTAQFKCCSQTFCYNHVNEHRQQLNKQLDEIEIIHDIFRQTLTEQIDDPQKHSLIQQINKWEQDSIEKIQQTAEEARQLIFKHTNVQVKNIEIQLAKLTDQLRENREGNNFIETDLKYWNEELTRLEEEFIKPQNISIQQNSTSLVNRMFVQIFERPYSISLTTKWMQNGITIAGGNGGGDQLNQLSFPYGIVIDDDQTIYIADSGNHRIVEWKCNAPNGRIVAGGNGRGNQSNQLNYPLSVIIDKENNSLIISDRDNKRIVRWSRQDNANGQIIISDIDCERMAMDKNGSLYVSNYIGNEVRQWKIGDKDGTIVAGGNGQGDDLNQLNNPTSIFVDEDYSLYVSDCGNHRVLKWMKGAKEGIIVAGGNGQGNSLTQLYSPQGVIVDQLGQVYVAEHENHRVMRWRKDAKEGTIVVGGNEPGEESNQLNGPIGLSFDLQGNLYVVDSRNHRIQKFEIE